MYPIAIEKAERRLQRARECLDQLKSPKNLQEFLLVWTDFLLALNGVYTCLEQGAKSSPQSRQWFGQKKRFRKEDPLLQYLHQARNADEHGLSPVSKNKLPTAIITPGTGNPEAVSNIKSDELSVTFEYDPSKGHLPRILLKGPSILLVPVKDDRYGSTYDPPTKHLGQKIDNNAPLPVALMGFEYVSNLIVEARGLICAN